MSLQQSHLNVTKVVPYSESIKNFLKQNRNDESDVKELDNITLGGILSDINYAWICNGPRLEVLSTKNGIKVAAWTFGEVIKDYYTRITCVVDLLNTSKSPVLIVGLQSGGTRGMICLFDIRTSRVLRTIQLSKPVTSLHIVNSSSETNFPGPLRALDGILAVGTEQGHIYLIDLCLTQCEDAVSSLNKSQIRDEIYVCELIQIPLNEIANLEKHKENTLRSGDHLCLQLNEGCTEIDFILRGPLKNEVRLRANIVEVKISALHYCKQLGSLMVGYNFGAFQIYDLLGVKLNYSSPAYEDCIPVSHFAFQEPCDDPRAFCYIWVMYSNLESEIIGFPLAVMYSLSYETKEFLEGYGNLYQELLNCSIRFQTELKSLPTSKIERPIGANCVSLTSYTYGKKLLEQAEDRLALCNVVWTVYSERNFETFMCLFDLNQWYKEQMPRAPNHDDTSTYMVFASLTPHFNPQGALLDLKLDSKSLNQFTCAQRLEEHYFPNALSFNLVCLREADMIHLESIGVQKNLLSLIKNGGPLCLLRPAEIYQQCNAFGLGPISADNFASTQKGQREFILSVALENQLISFLCQCASEWSNGSQSITGCTLEFLVDWASGRVNFLKNLVNDICKPLFDYSGLRLDGNALITLNDCARQLKLLTTLYEFIFGRCPLNQFVLNKAEIETQCNGVKMISTYIEVLQWLLNVGLLPECPIFMYPRVDETERISAPYPVDSLIRYYKNRRGELFHLQGMQHQQENQSCDLLFIDNLIDIECGGDVLHSDWTKDDGSGLYPPPSLQALLRTYFIEDVDIVVKHCIFIYVFLDLAMTLDQSRYSPIITHLIKFPAVFKLSPSIIKITQAFWQLDHGDFSTAMAQLLDPLISNEMLQPWHHRIAVKALLAQGQHQHALLYHQVRKPPMTKIQDLIITITVLIVNDLLKEAFHFQRQNSSDCNQKELIRHFIEVCDKANKLFQVIQLPLNEVEELELIKYLQSNRREDTENYLVQYFLQRSRFAEAFENNDKINGQSFEKQGLSGQIEMNSRNSLVNRYKSTLPSVTQEVLSQYLQKPHLNNFDNCKIIERPDPMSVFVHQSSDKLKYKSSLILASLNKAKEIWAPPNKKAVPFLSTPKSQQNDPKSVTPVIIPTIIETIMIPEEEEIEGPPIKRQKLTPRKSIGDNSKKNNSLLSSTPIVKRKSVHSRKGSPSILDSYPGSPQSILKVRKLVDKNSPNNLRETSTTPELLDGEDSNEEILITPFSDLTKRETSKNSLIDLSDYNIRTPKKSVRLTPSVRFQEKRASTPSSEASSVENMEMEVDIEAQTETPKIQKEERKVKERNIPIILEDESTPKAVSGRKRKLNDSVQSRRSYKENSNANSNNTSAILESIDKGLETPKAQDVKTAFPKVSGRKSLTRKVLEQNTLSKALSSPRRSLNRSNNISVVEISHTETVKSLVKETYINKVEKSENKNVFEVKNTYSSETDPSTSSHVIKINHNESHTKSSSKLTEFLDENASDISSIDPILTQGSDIDESFLIKYIKTSPNLNAMTESLTENTQDDITEDILQEENEDIIEIQSLDNNKDNVESTESEEFVSIENSENLKIDKNEDKVILNLVSNNQSQFEITDDLTDEDVSFTIHSTMNVEIDPNKSENILEIKDIEPENYLEPNFEEEVRNVLGEDSEVDEQFLSKYTEKQNDDPSSTQTEESHTHTTDSQTEEHEEQDDIQTIEEQDETIDYEDEKISDEEEEENSDEESKDDNTSYEDAGSERAENKEKIEVSEESEEDEECTSEDEKISDEEEEENDDDDDSEIENQQNEVIQIDSSSEEEMNLQIDESHKEDSSEDASSLDPFEKNIIETPNITSYNLTEGSLSDPNLINILETNVSESNFDLSGQQTNPDIVELAPMEIQYNYQNEEIVSQEAETKITIVDTHQSCEILIQTPLDQPIENFEAPVEVLETPKEDIESSTSERQDGESTENVVSLVEEVEDQNPVQEEESPILEPQNLPKDDLPNEEMTQRKTRARSVDVEKNEHKSYSLRTTRSRKASTQIEEGDKHTTEKPNTQDLIEIEESSNDSKKELRRGRKPSVSKEILEETKVVQEKDLPSIIEVEESSGNLGRGKSPSRRRRKASVPKEIPEETEAMQEEVLPSVMEAEEIPRNLEIAKSYSRRGRKPSVSKETPEETEAMQEVLPCVMEAEKTPGNLEIAKFYSRHGSKPSVSKEIPEKTEAMQEEALPGVIEVEEIPGNLEIAKSYSRRGRKPSVSKEIPEETEAMQEEALPSVTEAEDNSGNLEIAKSSSRRGRKPNVPKEILEEPEDVKKKVFPNVMETEDSSANLERDKSPSRRERKPSVPKEISKKTEALQEKVLPIIEETKKPSENIERVKSPSTRSRKPSISKVVLSKEEVSRINWENVEETQVAEESSQNETKSSGNANNAHNNAKTLEEDEKPKIDQTEETSSRKTKNATSKQTSQDLSVQDTDYEVVSTKRTRSASVQKEDTSHKEFENNEVKPRRGRKPSVSKDVPEESSIKEVPGRRGRKPSQSEDLIPEVSTPKKRGRKPSVEMEEKIEVSTPRRNTRRTSLQLEMPEILEEKEEISTPSRRNTRRNSVQSENQEPKTLTPSRTRTRKLSTQSEDVNLPVTPSRRGRRPSVQSEDVKLTPSRRTRASSVLSDTQSPVKSASETGSSKATSLEKIEEYTATHRLTRRQKVIIEGMMKEKGPPTGNIDPLTFLDKETFSGEPDLEEQFHQNKSPASSVCTESSIGTQSSLRIQSKRTTPDRSYTKSPSLPSTPRRGKTRASLIKIDQPIVEEQEYIEDLNEPSTSSGRGKRKSLTDYAVQKVFGSPAKRTRKHSEGSNVSEACSVKSEAVVILQKLDIEKIGRLRHRSLSPSTLKSDKIDSLSRVQRKGRHSILAKTDLSKISEEGTSAELEKTPTKSEELTIPKKRGRAKRI